MQIQKSLPNHNPLPTHFFVSSTDGSLHDTRQANWHKNPLRVNYSGSHSTIATVADLKATLRAGNLTFPGCYPLCFITSDGAPICFDCARNEFRSICDSIKHNIRDGWKIEACDVNYEDQNCFCGHCSEKIASAYGED